jgi:hypothetical protein
VGGRNPRALNKRRPLTQAEKTPEPLPHPYTGAPLPVWVRTGTFLSCFGVAAGEGIFLTPAWNSLPPRVEPRTWEECYWCHLTNLSRHPFATWALLTTAETKNWFHFKLDKSFHMQSFHAFFILFAKFELFGCHVIVQSLCLHCSFLPFTVWLYLQDPSNNSRLARLQICSSFIRISRAADKALLPHMKVRLSS